MISHRVQEALFDCFHAVEWFIGHALVPVHDFLDPLCKLTAEYDLAGPCSGAKLLVLGGLHILGFAVVFGVWGPTKYVPKAEDQILKFAADEGLPTSSSSAKSTGVKLTDRSALRQRN